MEARDVATAAAGVEAGALTSVVAAPPQLVSHRAQAPTEMARQRRVMMVGNSPPAN